MIEVWDLWFPGAGATGMSIARSRVDGAASADRLLVHADDKSAWRWALEFSNHI